MPCPVGRIQITSRRAGERIAQCGVAPSARNGVHQAQGLNVDSMTAAVEIKEPAGPVLAILLVRIAAVPL